MNKSFWVVFGLGMLIALTVIYAETPKVSRMGQQVILNTGGTGTTDGKTVVVSEDGAATNEFSVSVITATVAGAVTASTNTFSTAYLATPTAIRGVASGISQIQMTNLWIVGTTVSTSSVIVTGLSTNATSGINNLPVFIYGYKRAGVLE